MEKIEGDLTYIETSGFKTLAKNSGAKDVYIYVGDEVSIEFLKGVLLGQISRNEIEQLIARKN